MITKDLSNKLISLPIEKVAEYLNISIRKGHKLCPFHDDKHHPSLSLMAEKIIFIVLLVEKVEIRLI